MEPYLHKKTVKIPIYPGELQIILSNDVELVTSHIKGFEEEEFVFAHAWIHGGKNNRKKVAVILNFHYVEPMTHGTVTHEALHAAGFILDYCDVKYTFYNDEPFAYLIAWVTDQIYSFLDKHQLYPA